MQTNSTLSPLVLLFCIALLSPVTASAQQRELVGIDSIVDAIENLEAKSDAKCHATATRLENFMYGTPLTSAARDRKVAHQKALILEIWSEASRKSREQGLSAVPAELIAPLAAETLPIVNHPSGDVTLRQEGLQGLVLTERDIRQYSSIAYALRAILSVQQEALFSPELELLPLSQEAVDELKRLIDLGTLATLNLSDRIARREEALEVTPAILTEAWSSVFPAPASPTPPRIEVASAAVEPGQLLRRIIDQKIASYETYNQLEKAGRLLYNNVRSFYARHDLPIESAGVDAVTRIFTRVMTNVVSDYIERAEEIARKSKDPVIREPHVERIFDEVAPFEVNKYEDITYFHHLPREERVTIEAYDADSFRDSGLHWILIRNALDSDGTELVSDFDPFAAELLAEGTAQIGVLMYRVAGMIAKEEGSPILKPEHILSAAQRINSLMKRHLETPPPPRRDELLASAPSSAGTPEGAFFREITDRIGIRFMNRSADWVKRFERSFVYLPEGVTRDVGDFVLDVPPVFGGSGVAADDLDGDGDDEILILGGLENVLYVNNGDGTFTRSEISTLLTPHGTDGKPGEPRQPLMVDFDNDGRRDIFISYVDAPHRLYRNLGGLEFEDVSAKARLGGEGLVGSSATALDFDRDGLLDLYISYYGNYLQGDGPTLARINEGTTPNRLFRNTGGFVFEDVTERSGTGNTGWTQAVAAIDFDGDGWQDLIVGNDFGVNSWYRNNGNGTFEDISAALDTRHPSNSMNVGTADLNRDGYPDVYISNIFYMVKDEKYVNPTAETKMRLNPEKIGTMRIYDANHLFTSITDDGRLEKYEFSFAVDRGDTSTGWAWDADFFDFDNDGDDDLYCVNGLNEYNTFRPRRFDSAEGDAAYARPGYERSANVREANVFFVNEDGKLRNRSKQSGADLVVNSRAAAYLDYDGDGDLDIVVNNYQEPASFLENLSDPQSNNWINVKLLGDPEQGSNRDAIGATILAVTSSGNRIWRAVQGGTGYLSDHPKVQHIGLGDDEVVDLTVRWPNGETTEHRALEANRLHVIEQPAAEPPAEIVAEK
ncbi:MAG: CRTAC1 family protein [Acidobacteria bacterium]|nr:CRTAC1 family protein [Acidobacteriota bacterium]